jgi:hypothetical protein
MTRTYRYGYGADRWSAADLDTKWGWANLHPEFRRRLLALFNASLDAGQDVGCGGGARNAQAQEAEFYRRHQQAPTANGSRMYKGIRWYLKDGMAPYAPPGSSNHETGVYEGFALAVDVVGWETGWVENNCARFGLKSFKNVNKEPWHLQPAEFPNSRSDVNAHIAAGGRLTVPTPPVAPPQPTPTAPTPVTKPALKEIEMIVLDHKPNTPEWTALIWTGAELSHVFNGHADAVLRRAGVGRQSIADHELDGIIVSSTTKTDCPVTFTGARQAAWEKQRR